MGGDGGNWDGGEGGGRDLGGAEPGAGGAEEPRGAVLGPDVGHGACEFLAGGTGVRWARW